jgi:hypothetical protein
MALLIEVVAALREAVGAAIPRIITLLGDDSAKVRMAGVLALSTFSKHGKVSNFLVWRY